VALVYVTGLSGTGKSTVMRALRARGVPAYGVDEDCFGEWVERSTGRVVPIAAEPLDIHDWYVAHEWRLSVDRIGGLKRDSDDAGTTAYLCGVASGDDAVWRFFDVVIALVLDFDTIRERIERRTDNAFGKTPGELAEIAHWHSRYEVTYRGFGAVLVDAAKPVDVVVAEVLRAGRRR